MMSKCSFKQYNESDKDNIENINDLRILLVGSNNSNKSHIIKNFLFENESINGDNSNETNEIFTLIKETKLSLLNCDFDLNIKFVLDKVNILETCNVKSYDIIILTFDINNSNEFTHIKQFYGRLENNYNGLIFFAGIDRSKDYWSLYNRFKSEYISELLNKFRHYYYEINIDKFQIHKFFSIVVEKFIFSLINDIDLTNNNLPVMLQSIIKYEMSKRKYINQIAELNTIINNHNINYKRIVKQSGEFEFKNIFLEQQNKKLILEIEKMTENEKKMSDMIREMRDKIESLENKNEITINSVLTNDSLSSEMTSSSDDSVKLIQENIQNDTNISINKLSSSSLSNFLDNNYF